MATATATDQLSETLEAWARRLIDGCPYWFSDVEIWGVEPLAVWFVARRAGRSEPQAFTALLRRSPWGDKTLVRRIVVGWPLLDEPGVPTTQEVA